MSCIANESLPEAYRNCRKKLLRAGCIGFGLERIAIASFVKHGLDTDRWPTDVQDVLDL